MAPSDRADVTLLLQRACSGDPQAEQQIYEVLYTELHRIAGRHMGAQAAAHTLQPTALLHEAWLRLVRQDQQWSSREHFLAFASRAMRSVLVDHARRKQADKRSSGERVPLDDSLQWFEERGLDLLALNEALEGLGRADAQAAKVVDLLYFGGLTMAESASVLGVSVRTVERAWRSARAFLHASLTHEPFPADTGHAAT